MVWLGKVTEMSLYAIIFTLPFSKSMVEIFFVVALVSWIMKRWIEYRVQSAEYREQNVPFKKKTLELIKAFKPVKTELNLPIAAFVFIGFLSMLTSVSLPLSLEGFFFKLFQCIMLYFIVVEVIDSREKFNRILWVMLFSIALITVDAIFQFITGADFLRNYSMGANRIQASFKGPNSFAAWLLVMIPLTLSLAYVRINDRINLPDKHIWLKKVVKSLLWVMAVLLIVCLALTYTRGACIAFVLSLIFLTVVTSKKLLLFVIIALLIIPFVVPEGMKERMSSILRIKEVDVKRNYMWREALNIVEDFPLLGSGLNTYATVAPNYKIGEMGGIYPHNSYLRMAAESGLLGLGAFIWMMVTLFKISLSSFKRIQDRFHGVVLIGLLAGLFGFLAHSFVDTNIHTLQLGNLMWFIMGLIIAVRRLT